MEKRFSRIFGYVFFFFSVVFLYKSAVSNALIYLANDSELGAELDWFDGISTLVGYLIPNLVYIYILDIYDL